MENAKILMCGPEHFGVQYVINPWMEGKLGTVTAQSAWGQWGRLYTLLTETIGVHVVRVPAVSGLPDMVFTANAGLVYSGLCVPSRFRHAERKGEEPYFEKWFSENYYRLLKLPKGIAFEGAGDALFYQSDTPGKPLLFAAHGFRTDLESHEYLSEGLTAEVISLKLVDPRFYHLDTCFCPLAGGCILWYPPAFDEESQARIIGRIHPNDLCEVSEEDALAFACNAVSLGENVVLNAASERLKEWLADRGFVVHETPLTEFMKAGGSAKCLTLRVA